MSNYVDTPCPCQEGDHCPHYGKHLVGMIWALSRGATEKARDYRAMWTRQVRRQGRQIDPNKPRIAKGQRPGG